MQGGGTEKGMKSALNGMSVEGRPPARSAATSARTRRSRTLYSRQSHTSARAPLRRVTPLRALPRGAGFARALLALCALFCVLFEREPAG